VLEGSQIRGWILVIPRQYDDRRLGVIARIKCQFWSWHSGSRQRDAYCGQYYST